MATELENAPRATISTKPCENLGEGCVAAQIRQGHLWFKVHLHSLTYRVGGRYTVAGPLGRWVDRQVAEVLPKGQPLTAHRDSKGAIVSRWAVGQEAPHFEKCSYNPSQYIKCTSRIGPNLRIPG